MSAQHTPGPWSRDKYGHIIDANGNDVRFRSLTILASSGSDERMAEAEGNTDLAAAAPEMLAVLRDCLPFIDDANDIAQFFPESAATNACRGAVKRAHEIIAKVTGSAA